jgi:muconolactone delta-isomerase
VRVPHALAPEQLERLKAEEKARARECCADHGGTPEASGAEVHREGSAGVWRNAFIRMPYLFAYHVGR